MEQRYVAGRQRLGATAVFAGCAIGLLIVALVRASDETILILVVAGVCATAAIRAFFCATVIVSEEGMHYRGLVRDLRRPWSEILRFELEEYAYTGDGFSGEWLARLLGLRYVRLVMFERSTDSSPGHRRELSTLNWTTRNRPKAEQIKDWLNDYLERYGRRPNTGREEPAEP